VVVGAEDVVRTRVGVTWVVVWTLLAFGCSRDGSQSTTLIPVTADGSVQSVGVGACSPDVALPGHFVDCRFPVVGDPEIWGLLPGRATAVFHRGQISLGSSLPCAIEENELVCRGLRAQVDAGSVGVAVGSEVVPERADLTVLSYAEAESWPRVRIPQLEVSPGLFVETDTQVTVVRDHGTDPVWGLITRLPERDVIEAVGLLGPGELRASSSLLMGDPGVYELATCLGADVSTCDRAPSGYRFHVFGDDPVELVVGHNDREADRINVVVTGGGFVASDKLANAAETLMSPDAAPILTGHTAVVDDENPEAVWFPPFAIDPLRAMADRINVWLLPDPVDYVGGDLWGLTQDEWIGVTTEYNGLRNVTFVHLQAVPYGHDVAGAGSLASFAGAGSAPQSQDGIEFGRVAVDLDPQQPWRSSQVVVHEMGHAVFGLWDEYFDTNPGQEDWNDEDCDRWPPHLAAKQTEAEAWWGHLVGEIDPFFYEYRNALMTYDLWDEKKPFDFERTLSVGFYPTACPIKPTGYSIMAWVQPDQGAIPVFGTVNRLWAEKILQLWTGM
jgi:hypothetical protein